MPLDTQLDMFDARKSEAAKLAGKKRAAAVRREKLKAAREIAVELLKSRDDGITADDVVAEIVRRGGDPHELRNAAGSLFRNKRFITKGEMRKSTRTWAHSNRLLVWYLNQE